MSIFFPPHQETVFALMALVGAFLGFLYDVFKLKRTLFGSCYLVLFADDFLYSLFSCTIFLFSVFVLNNGRIRWYEFAFCTLGFFLYRITLSKIIMPVFEFVARTIKMIVVIGLSTFSKPFVLLFSFLFKRAIKILLPIVICLKIRGKKNPILRFIKNVWS